MKTTRKFECHQKFILLVLVIGLEKLVKELQSAFQKSLEFGTDSFLSYFQFSQFENPIVL